MRQTDGAACRLRAREQFSGTLCSDEIHLGQKILLLATDPLSDFPVALALVSSNDQDHMRRFLANLRCWGFWPHVVITAGSTLYPTLLAELGPYARHQLCVFQVLQDINQDVFDAVKVCKTATGWRRNDRGRETALICGPPPSEPDRRISRIRLSRRWSYPRGD